LKISEEDIELKDDEEKTYYEKLKQLIESDLKVMDFPSTLDKKQRAKVHKLAELLGTRHTNFSIFFFLYSYILLFVVYWCCVN
jgi:type I site-specific restriction-modification system R (restriction) subunit